MLFIGVLLTCTAAVYSQELPAILKAHYEAVGMAKLAKAQSLYLKGVMKLPGTAYSVPFQTYIKPGNKLRTDSKFEGTTITLAFDGKQGWQINPMSGSDQAEVLPPGEPELLRLQAGLYSPLYDYEARGYQLRLAGQEMINDINCYHLILSTESGAEVNYYLGAENHFILLSKSTLQWQGEPLESISTFSSFRKVNGVVFPMRIDIRHAQQHTRISLQKISFNVQVADQFFEMPEG
ncbi:MAG: hypothetical protein D6730_03910 [Bacteroidetes bacterium]|nr:MAG: hypothetical protein D6730_03910 [Bacteroidota bacterium]